MPPTDAVWYHVFPLGFCGAEAANPAPGADGGGVQHRLPSLVDWLDHIAGLGVTGLVLGPVFESETHGYDTVDYLRVDRRLGDEADLVRLFDESHRRGLQVVLDGVFNHVGRGFGPFADVVANGAASPYAGWFRCRFLEDGTLEGCDVFEGHERLVALNHDNPEVVELVVGVARHWLDRGADGFRLDAAYAVPPAFWRSFTAQARSSRPDTWLMAEVIHGDYTRFVDRSGVDTLTQYELWKAIWSSLNDRNFFELAYALGRHASYTESFVPYTFVGNHDVTRIATQLTDRRHVGHALAVLFTVPGTPAVYYGDEFGLTAEKRHEAGGDDDIRPAFPAAGSWPPGADDSVLEVHKSLIALRRREPWLSTATLTQVHLQNESYAYVAESAAGGRQVLVILNVGDREVRVSPPDGAAAWSFELGSAPGEANGDAVTVGPHSWQIGVK